MNHRIPRCIAACLLASACAAQATELVYTPVNPAFGGNPLNGTWLLNNAQAQNDYDDPDPVSYTHLTLPTSDLV